MPEIVPLLRTDRRLLPFLRAKTDEAAERALRRLLEEHAEPVITGVIRRSWRFKAGRFETEERSLADNARSDIVYETVRRLQRARSGLDPTPIADFPAYVAVTAFHACDRHLRRLRPERYRLKLQLRTLLLETPGFALWEADKSWLCGFSAWQKEGRRPDARLIRSLTASPRETFEEGAGERRPGEMPLSEVVAGIFNAADSPVVLEDLVGITAQLLGIREPSASSLTVTADSGETEMDVADPALSIENHVQLRDYLQRLWQEIVALPIRQRTALLLNLRGEQGRDGVALFPLSHIASQDEIADALEMATGELAHLWDSLPLDDETIARRLGRTRAQVIGLRNAAKHRLHRRMQASERIPGLS